MAPRHLKKRTYKIKKSALILVVSLCLMFTSVVGGTYAWLYYDGSGSSASSFVGTTVALSFSNKTETQIMVPGEYVSIPGCSVASGSRNVWMFAKLDKGNTTSFSNCLEYSIASGWEQLSSSGADVIFGKTAAVAAGSSSNVFANSRITVKSTATKETIAGTADFTVKVQYCVVQSENLSYANAKGQYSFTI
ncbi:MAG: hypothetical protein IKU10_04320 [Clostridia bacterium]|nr:hypothetical protein [Clostridia bacterium]